LVVVVVDIVVVVVVVVVAVVVAVVKRFRARLQNTSNGLSFLSTDFN